MKTNFNELAAAIHQENILWWKDLETGEPIQRNKAELIMLMVTELAEAVEGIRKDLYDDKIVTRKMEEVELGDCVIRILDYVGGFGLDLDGAIAEKRLYNRSRKDHSREGRLADGGKKF